MKPLGRQWRGGVTFRSYDRVVIGAGVRLPPRGLELFEVVINAIGKAAPGTAIAFDAAHHVRLIPDANVDPCAVTGLAVCSNTTGNPHEYLDHTRLLQCVDVVLNRGADALADADRL